MRIGNRGVGLAVLILAVFFGLGTGGPSPCAAAEPIADPALCDAVRSQVFGKRNTREPLVEADLARVSTIVARGLGIRSLEGLEKCRNLTLLDVAENRIVDLSPLRGLSRLQYLDARSNAVSDPGPLAGANSLQYLDLGENRIVDTTPLAGLERLATLQLGGNRIATLAPILGLSRLTSLRVENNRIASLEGIGRLSKLAVLSAGGNRIEDVRPLTGLTAPRQIFLENNRIRDLAVLEAWLAGDREGKFAAWVEVRCGGNPLSSEARRRQWPAMRAAGYRIEE